tara:strand:+ start:795 stop:1625 length:831 start_codon:yes stop_codon:yes gene_type:complete
MSFTLTLIILTLAVLLIASYFDIKTREIPDTLSYGYIVSVLGIRLIYSLQTDFSYFLYGLIGFVVFFLLGLVMYYLKQWGGGDSKLFMGIGAAFADFYLWNYPFLLILTGIVMLVGAIYASTWGTTIYYKHYKAMHKHFKVLIKRHKLARIITLTITVLLLSTAFFFQDYTIRLILVTSAAAIFFLFYLTLFIKVVEHFGFLKHTKVSKLTEGDWLAEDVILKGKVLVSSKQPCIDQKQINKLKKHRIKSVIIKVGIPFVPAIFLGTIIALSLYLI